MTEKELLEAYVEARRKKEQTKLMLDAAEEVLDKAEEELVAYLDSQNKKDTGMYPDLGKITITTPQVYASCTEKNKDACFKYLRECGREDLIKETVNARSLSSYTKDLIESSFPVPNCISYYLKPSVKFTRS